MGRTACTEPQCLYKGDLYLSTAYILPVMLQNRLHTHKSGSSGKVKIMYVLKTEHTRDNANDGETQAATLCYQSALPNTRTGHSATTQLSLLVTDMFSTFNSHWCST